MERGLSLQLELGRMPDAVSDLADAALTYAKRGDLSAAKQLAERAMTVDPSLTQAAIFPPYPPWIFACIFHWTNDERANDMLAQAADLVRSFCASIDSADLRERFEALPFVAAIADAQRGSWPAGTGHAWQRDTIDV